ncbi:M48 family metallopeptidase [Dinghuibacter silviterrae]|uniref:Peptidase M48-like protein n=1 Tax=Dinghuibacter silviterrae TaxID=1539049 RepID=A0A4R8DNF8_9BACT|nr:M48 family metallopeptidase [Dinghuibacter silviterrae]TDW99569.1 peptidase M48-like protein [Dinghuibacter silviterrae]
MPTRACALLLCLLLSRAYAQAPLKYTPAKDDSLALEADLSRVQDRYKQEVAALKGASAKQIADIYKERFDYIKEQFHTKALLTMPPAQAYLTRLLHEIVAANPGLQTIPIDIYFAKTGIPNASSIGDGVVVFNLGLFVRMDNESEAAFVLCHELAHVYLNHSNQSIARYVDRLNSKETQRELRHIKNEQYNKRADAEDLAKALSFDNTRHGRDHESQADSMGVVFMKATRFDPAEAITCLGLLDTVDKDNAPMEVSLQNTFDSPQYPFQPRWLHHETGLLSGHATIALDTAMMDSLKTHPDCQVRITALRPMITTTGRSKNPMGKTAFDSLKKILPYEILRYYYDTHDYAHCLMTGLELLQTRPGDPYIVSMIAGALSRIYDAQKNHTLGRMVPLPSPYYSASFDTLLQFLQNLRLEEIKNIQHSFIARYPGITS